MLRHGALVLPCGPDTLQFGLDPRWSLRLGGLDEAEIRWLQEAAKWQRAPILTARKHEIRPARAREIIETLAEADLLLPSPTLTKSTEEPGPTITASSPASELPTLSALRPDGGGRAALVSRARATVAITSAGRIGAEIALLLAMAGVGRLIIADSDRVQEADIGPYRIWDVGTNRLEAIRNMVAAIAPEAEVVGDGHAEVWVSIESGTQINSYFGALLAEAIPHLAIATQEAATEVGPFVLPNRSACIHCLHLKRTEVDADWPALIAEIARRPRLTSETILSSATASLAAGQILSFLDGTQPLLVNAIATISAPNVIPQVLPITPHPDCGCTNPVLG